jgi:hypothetical protein
MKTRVALVSSQSFGHSVTKYIEVADVAELAAEMNKAGARRVILYFRDRFGDGKTEGAEFPVSALSDTHFKWLLETPKEGMRGLYFDRRG